MEISVAAREELSHVERLLLQLLHGASPGTLVRTPAQDARAVPKAPAGEMIVGDLRYKFWCQWYPFA
jgi:hypothetical protein